MNPDQEIALKQMWASLLKFFGYDVGLSTEEIKYSNRFNCSQALQSIPSTSAVSFCSSDQLLDSVGTSESSFPMKLVSDKIRSTYHFLESGHSGDDDFDVFSISTSDGGPLLANYLPEEIHRSLWAACRNDSIDNFMLRFLRRSYFNHDASLKWYVEILELRRNKYKVDKLLSEGDAGFFVRGDKPKLIQAFKKNIIYLQGISKTRNPLFFVRVKKHICGECPTEDFKLLILLMFEWGRLRLLEFKLGVDKGQLFFDLSGFTLKNADYSAISFLIKACQRFYPDLLDRIYIHNAPKTFTIMWRIIVHWIRPDFRNKIIFTFNFHDLLEYIDEKHIPKSLGGIAEEEPQYIYPNESSYKRKTPDDLLAILLKQRDELRIKFIESTIHWIEAKTPLESRTFLWKKIKISKAMAENYVYLDPYLRQRGVFDRNGELFGFSI